MPVPPGQLRVIGEGRPLDPAIRRTMERFFQADFSAVRVHQGPAARAMGALAFTLGEEIHFVPGLYDPSTRAGVELLGHELTHVVQQRDGRVASPYGHGVAIVQDPALEAEADRMGQQIAEQLWSGSPGPAQAASSRMTSSRRAAVTRATLGPAVQRMQSYEQQAPPSITTVTSSSGRTPAVTTDFSMQYLVLVSLQAHEDDNVAEVRKEFLATLFPDTKLSILLLSEPTTEDWTEDPDPRALAPLYLDLGTVLETRFEDEEGNYIFLDTTKPFPPSVKGCDLILMRRGLCYCNDHEACCGVSREGKHDVNFLLEVGRALSEHKNAFALLGSRLATLDSLDDNNDKESYDKWLAAAAEAMSRDPKITVALVVHGDQMDARFVGLKVTYAP